MENPYAPDVISSVTVPVPVTDSSNEQDWLFEALNTSRNSIVLIALIMGFGSVINMFALDFFLIFRSSRSDFDLIAENPYWIFMNVARPICFGVIALQLWKYQKAIKGCASGSDMTRTQFATIHNRLWKIIAVSLIAIVLIAILAVWFS